MNEETVTINLTNFVSCRPKFKFSKVKDFSLIDEEPHDFVGKRVDQLNALKSLTEIIQKDDKDELLTRLKVLFVEKASHQEDGDDDDGDDEEEKENRDPNPSHQMNGSIISSLLQISCKLNSVECAKALIEGEAGTVPNIDAVDQNGLTALHSAAEMHATQCIELLLSKQARTDLRSRDGNSQLALEMALSSNKIQKLWSPDESIEDLLIRLSETDLSAIRMLTDKTKGILDVAYNCAMEARVISLTTLLMLVPEKVTSPIAVPRVDGIVDSEETTNIYECVIREALSLGQKGGGGGGARRILGYSNNTNNGEKRKLLLCATELLQLFGATLPPKVCTEPRIISSLIRAAQAGDVATLKLILKTNVDVNETDGEGNSALHWCLRTNINKQENNAFRIVCLLLKHGAKVGKRNRLGLTPVHIAAANGYLQALQILLLKDPDSVDAVSEMKETPLFFAVKNDFMDCAQLLLRHGANNQILNLRKQRAIDMAKSQDMRILLSPTNIRFRPRTIPIQDGTANCNWQLTSYECDYDSDEEICEALFNPTKEELTNNATADRQLPTTGAKTEICRYFESSSGCVRGAKCYYAHGEAELLGTKHRLKQSAAQIPHYPVASEDKRKIFVGGLPPSIDSETLGEFFAEQFGSVDEAFVIESQSSRDQTHSRGFGFVKFKEEESVVAAVQAHYVTVFGKKVEIKGAVPKPILLAEKPTARHGELLQVNQKLLTSEKTSWVDKLISGGTPYEGQKVQQQINISLSSSAHGLPPWVVTFRKWLPGFLMEVSRRLKEGEWYPLSSLKGDFRATCGLELDHASLGYTKLSDFMRSFPGICRMKVVPVGGGRGPATHMVLLPNHINKTRCPIQLHQFLPIAEQPSFDDNGNFDDDDDDDQEVVVDYHFVEGPLSNPGYENFRCSFGHSGGEGASNGNNSSSTSRFMSMFLNHEKSFLKWDPLFHGRPWFEKEKGNQGPEDMLSHETPLSEEKKPFSFFTRQYDFYENYRRCLALGKCFRCKKQRSHWVNKPCGHILWCKDCIDWADAQESMMKECYVCAKEITGGCVYEAWLQPAESAPITAKIQNAPITAKIQKQIQLQEQRVAARHDGTNEIDYPHWDADGSRAASRRRPR